MRTRRGLSSVVGMTFGIIALVTVLAYVNYSMTTLDQYNQSVVGKGQQILNQDLEKFQVTSVNVASNRLNVTVVNTGILPINFTKMWVQNTTALSMGIDWAKNYPLTNTLVVPGGTLKNIGTTLPLSINPSNSYYVKLITSRSNMGQFTINSASAAPLNIQFYSFPAVVPNKFTSELVMIVTNNGSATLTNIVPQQPVPVKGTASYTLSAQPVPPSYNTLPPGTTAVFKWDVKMLGANGQNKTFSVQLQNGYPGNSAQATISISDITASSSVWSTTWGVLSINFTSLQWTKDNGVTWNNAWSVPAGPAIVWRVNLTNNDPVRQFILNGNSSLVAFTAAGGSNVATPFYMIKDNFPPLSAYPTNHQNISANSTVTIYLGSSTAGIGSSQAFPTASTAKGTYSVSILIFGFWTSVQTNNFFGQNIPYEGIVVS